MVIWQVDAKSGAVKAYYSWRVQNPSEALHDDMVEVKAADGSRSVHIGWSEEAERNARSVTVTGDTSQQSEAGQTVEATLYGSVVGVSDGRNEFTLSYKDSAHRLLTSGHLLSILTASAFAVLISGVTTSEAP